MYETSRWGGMRDASPEREVCGVLRTCLRSRRPGAASSKAEEAVQVPRKVFDYGLVENVLLTVTVTLLDDGVEV